MKLGIRMDGHIWNKQVIKCVCFFAIQIVDSVVSRISENWSLNPAITNQVLKHGCHMRNMHVITVFSSYKNCAYYGYSNKSQLKCVSCTTKKMLELIMTFVECIEGNKGTTLTFKGLLVFRRQSSSFLKKMQSQIVTGDLVSSSFLAHYS
jgi:hypothetical protein